MAGRCARWLVQAQDQEPRAVRHVTVASCRPGILPACPPPHRLGLALAACHWWRVPPRGQGRASTSGRGRPAVAQNVRTALVAQRRARQGPSARRLNHLLRQAERETREALEPFGYHSPTITIRQQRPLTCRWGSARNRRRPMPTRSTIPMTADGLGTDGGAPAAASTTRGAIPSTRPIGIQIVLGEPVRVRREQVDVDGPGAGDGGVREAGPRSHRARGAVLDHSVYEGRQEADLQCPAAARLFRCRPRQPPGRVTARTSPPTSTCAGPPANATASGEPPAGPKPIIATDLLQKLVNWEPGRAYDAAELDRLRSARWWHWTTSGWWTCRRCRRAPANARCRWRSAWARAAQHLHRRRQLRHRSAAPRRTSGSSAATSTASAAGALAQLGHAKDRKALTTAGTGCRPSPGWMAEVLPPACGRWTR